MTFDIILVKDFEHLSSADTINLVIENLRRTQKRVRHGRDRRIIRSSHQRCSMKKTVLRNFTKFTGKHLCQCLFFNKVTLVQVFCCGFWEISKNTFFTEHF